MLLVGLMLHAGDPQSADWWRGAIPFGIWIIGPAVAPWLIARARPKPFVVLSMLVFLILSSTISAIAYFDAFFRSTSSTAGLVMIFMPLIQWAALTVLSAVAIAASVWIERNRA